MYPSIPLSQVWEPVDKFTYLNALVLEGESPVKINEVATFQRANNDKYAWVYAHDTSTNRFYRAWRLVISSRQFTQEIKDLQSIEEVNA